VKAGVRSLSNLNGNSDHHDLLIFLIKTFIDQEINIDMPDNLEKKLVELIKLEL